MCTLHVVDYCRFYSSKQVKRMASVSTRALSISVVSETDNADLQSSLSSTPLTQGKAECSTLYSESLMSMERCHFIVHVTLTIKPSTVHLNLHLGFIKNACIAIQQSEGEGGTSSKKTRPITTSYTDVLHDVVTTSWGVHASMSSRRRRMT